MAIEIVDLPRKNGKFPLQPLITRGYLGFAQEKTITWLRRFPNTADRPMASKNPFCFWGNRVHIFYQFRVWYGLIIHEKKYTHQSPHSNHLQLQSLSLINYDICSWILTLGSIQRIKPHQIHVNQLVNIKSWTKNSLLVVSTPLKKYEFVSWDDEISNICTRPCHPPLPPPA